MSKLRGGVLLIELAQEHAMTTLEWVKEPSVAWNIGLRGEPSYERTTEWIKNASASDDIFPFAIIVGGTHVGNVILDKVDRFLSSARLSIYIGYSDNRGSGIGRTATHKICRFGFEKLLLNKIWLTVHSKNFRGINAYTQAGFRLEGILREEFKLGDEFVNVLYMGMLKIEFEMLRLPQEKIL
jgi:RimJ/RimL family protein N-acetyltransferase